MPLVPASGTGMRRGAAARVVARGNAGAADGARHQAQAQGTAAAAARPAAQPAVPAGPGASPSPGGFLRLPCRRLPFCRGSPGSPWGSPRRFLGPKHAVTREPSPHMRRDLRRSTGYGGGRPTRAAASLQLHERCGAATNAAGAVGRIQGCRCACGSLAGRFVAPAGRLMRSPAAPRPPPPIGALLEGAPWLASRSRHNVQQLGCPHQKVAKSKPHCVLEAIGCSPSSTAPSGGFALLVRGHSVLEPADPVVITALIKLPPSAFRLRLQPMQVRTRAGLHAAMPRAAQRGGGSGRWQAVGLPDRRTACHALRTLSRSKARPWMPHRPRSATACRPSRWRSSRRRRSTPSSRRALSCRCEHQGAASRLPQAPSRHPSSCSPALRPCLTAHAAAQALRSSLAAPQAPSQPSCCRRRRRRRRAAGTT